MSKETLTGWGRTSPSVAEVVTPKSEQDVLSILERSPAVLARGLGRSYGDAAQVAGGTVISNRGLTGVSEVSSDGVVRVGAGVSIDELLASVMEQGWFVPVTPGTRQVTMGGAVAADVHGKNHHVEGSFCDHVLSMRLATPTGLRVVTPTDQADLFWATAGAMGLTGIATEVTLKLTPIETDRVLVDTDRYGDLDSVMAAMVESDDHYRYSVAWVDCMTKGAHMGRAILTRGRHATKAELPEASLTRLGQPRLAVPIDPPSGLLNTLSIRAFNEAWYRRAPQHKKDEPQALSTFFHPLDGVRGWNRMYGKRGFVQYQFVVDDHHTSTVRSAIELLSSSQVPSFLAVLKRFGPANAGLLSFPSAGWTLALDLPVGPPALPGVLDALDDMVVNAGGRVYLAKDARLAPEHFATMYPRLNDLRAIKAEVDPNGVLVSDLSRRLEI